MLVTYIYILLLNKRWPYNGEPNKIIIYFFVDVRCVYLSYVYDLTGKVTHKQKIICMSHLITSICTIHVHTKDVGIPASCTNVYVLLCINVCEVGCSNNLSWNALVRLR